MPTTRPAPRFRRVGGEADSLAKKIDALNALGPGLRNVFAGLGVSVGFAEAIRQAAAFETALVSMRRVTSRSASELKADIAGLGPELGSQTQLMQGLYTVYSSGVTEAAKAVDLLTTASKASKVSGVSQAQAVDALTSLMTGYTGELNRAAEAYDLLFAIEKQGKTTVGEVIPVIGELAGVSKQAGISADEMGAQFSALTLTSGGTAKAATQYKAAVMELLRPNEKLAGLIGRLGYESGTAMVKQNGLARTWRMLDAAARQSGSSLAQFLSSEESLVGLAPQLETAFAQHAANLDAMNKKTGETDASFARWKETLNGLKDTTANMLDNLGTQGGNLFAPAAAEGLRQLNDVLKLLSDNFDTVAAGTVVLGSGLAGMTAAKKLAANETARYAAETIKLEAAQLRGKVTLLGSAQAVSMKAQADTEAALAARNAARAELERFEAERRSALAVQNGTDNAIIRARAGSPATCPETTIDGGGNDIPAKVESLAHRSGLLLKFSGRCRAYGENSRFRPARRVRRPGRAGGDGADRRARLSGDAGRRCDEIFPRTRRCAHARQRQHRDSGQRVGRLQGTAQGNDRGTPEI